MLQNELSAVEAVRLMRGGQMSVSELVEACLARIAAREEAVAAWSFLDPDLVRAEAARLDRLNPGARGPLHGLPVGVKDVIYTKDMPTGHNSPIYESDSPRVDAAPVKTLRAAGALIFGKTVTTEFAATSRGGTTRNPHDPERTPGGSSSGSAAAVADNQVPLALGTQTGGSTIRPASFNGVYALKPTWNVISREGLKVYSLTCDTLGLYARAVADLDLLADVFRLGEPAAPRPLEGVKIAVCRTPMWERADTATRDALALGEALLREAGATVTALTLPPLFSGLSEHHGVVLAHEGKSAFLSEAVSHPDLLHPDFMGMVENKAGLDADQVRQAYDVGARCRIVFDEIASAYDAVLAPSVTGEAPRGLAWTGDHVFCSMWTFLHVPVVNVPGFRGQAGMPVGLSLIGARFSDRRLLAVADAVGALFAARGSWASGRGAAAA